MKGGGIDRLIAGVVALYRKKLGGREIERTSHFAFVVAGERSSKYVGCCKTLYRRDPSLHDTILLIKNVSPVDRAKALPLNPPSSYCLTSLEKRKSSHSSCLFLILRHIRTVRLFIHLIWLEVSLSHFLQNDAVRQR